MRRDISVATWCSSCSGSPRSSPAYTTLRSCPCEIENIWRRHSQPHTDTEHTTHSGAHKIDRMRIGISSSQSITMQSEQKWIETIGKWQGTQTEEKRPNEHTHTHTYTRYSFYFANKYISACRGGVSECSLCTRWSDSLLSIFNGKLLRSILFLLQHAVQQTWSERRRIEKKTNSLA